MCKITVLAGVFCVVAIGLCACGGASDEVLARVDGTAITATAVSHLAAVLARERVSPGSHESLRRYSLSLLVVTQWLLDEARLQGMAVSRGQAERAVASKVALFPGGAKDFDSFRKLSGRTRGDVLLAERRRLAASKLLHLLESREPAVTHQQVARYYTEHKASFVANEQRKVNMAHSANKSSVEAIKRGMTSGAQYPPGVVEALEYARGAHPANENAVYAAVYSAAPGVPTGPVREAQEYFVFELTHVIPARQEPLAAVKEEISANLKQHQHEATLTAFSEGWLRRWKPRTTCRPGWIVLQCRQYSGPQSVSKLEPLATE